MLFNLPALTSQSLERPGSPSEAFIVLVDAQSISVADDGGVDIAVSTQTSLQMDSAATNNSASPTATAVVSMRQSNSIAIRAIRYVNWVLRRSSGVAIIRGVTY